MKVVKMFLVMIVFRLLVLGIAALPNQQENDIDKLHVTQESTDEQLVTPESSEEVHELGRFLWQTRKQNRLRLTCNKFSRLCQAKGSPGPDCCKKKCVNVLKDRLNCGRCGKKCRYNQICCSGKCVNPSFNERHCGGCNNNCGNGRFCAFGLCNYA